MLFDLGDTFKLLSNSLVKLSNDLPFITRYFKALGLASAYNNLINITDKKTITHPEVQRVPEMRTLILEHLRANADQHIDIDSETIFNETVIGNPADLRSWQNAGYKTRRTPSNYENRLRYWVAIYDEADLLKITGEALPEGHASSGRVKSKDGQVVTYEDVIAERINNYSFTVQEVPFWYPLNYGTMFGANPGYPNVAGLHFVEDAEKQIPRYLNKFSQYLEDYLLDSINRISDGQERMPLQSWIRKNIRFGKEYMSSARIADVLTREE